MRLFFTFKNTNYLSVLWMVFIVKYLLTNHHFLQMSGISDDSGIIACLYDSNYFINIIPEFFFDFRFAMMYFRNTLDDSGLIRYVFRFEASFKCFVEIFGFLSILLLKFNVFVEILKSFYALLDVYCHVNFEFVSEIFLLLWSEW